jgi:prepilin-type N-terminal cleavage/methylation domain-containing protein/prepilin-type processing-associated H-X9-DG protein
MIYIHELESVLSSIFRLQFFLASASQSTKYHGSPATRAMARNSHFARAFTLIEMIVVLAIIAILMSMAYPMFTSMSERAKATKDMSNLRQIGLATQTFLNDNDGVLFSSATAWSSQLQLNKKYLSVWRVLQSPFDKRSPGEAGNATTPISYGVNANIYPNVVGTLTALPASKITNPTGFILFAPAQASGAAGATVSFQGTALSTAPGVTVAAVGGNAVQSSPGGNVTNGTHNSRKLINVLFADLHCETMSWTAFANTTAANQDEPNQWTPYLPYP